MQAYRQNRKENKRGLLRLFWTERDGWRNKPLRGRGRQGWGPEKKRREGGRRGASQPGAPELQMQSAVPLASSWKERKLTRERGGERKRRDFWGELKRREGIGKRMLRAKASPRHREQIEWRLQSMLYVSCRIANCAASWALVSAKWFRWQREIKYFSDSFKTFLL